MMMFLVQMDSITGVRFYLKASRVLNSALYSFVISSSSNYRGTQFGDRCRDSFNLKALFQTRRDPMDLREKENMLTPQYLIKKDAKFRKDQQRRQISGPVISTPTESSQTGLIQELLQIIQEMSDIHWQREDGTSSSDSMSSSESILSFESDDESWQMVSETPMEPPPPIRAPDHPPQTGSSFRYCQF
nr:ORF3 [Torque teno felis virus]